MKTVVPRDIPNTWLRTFGRETMGDAPIVALTVRTTPKDMTSTDATISRRSFLNVGLLVTGVLLSGVAMVSDRNLVPGINWNQTLDASESPGIPTSHINRSLA